MTHYAQFVKHYSWARRARSLLRDSALFFLSLPASMAKRQPAIRFACYHHVFDDERLAFARQLKYLRNFGEFIALDEAVGLLRSGQIIDGHYFCVTFDDGYRNCLTNALPILQEQQCVATFFIVSALADAASRLQTSHVDPDAAALVPDRALLQRIFGFVPQQLMVPFLSWEDCRLLQAAGMTIAAHTRTHRNLTCLSVEEIRQEMRGCRADIEQHLGRDVPHIACPVGRPLIDFRPNVEPMLAAEEGFQSFLTSERGANCRGGDPYRIRRDHLCAWWGNYQVKYFFSSPCPLPRHD